MMKKRMTGLLLLMVSGIFLGGSALLLGQVTNLKVNNSTTPVTMMSGDTLRWEYNLPVGGVATVRIWYDADNNGSFDSLKDLNVFTFGQLDGDTMGIYNGPPDLDGSVNGHILFYQRVGLWAGTYFFSATNSGVGMMQKVTFTALSPVARTISGHVVPPSGMSAAGIVLELSSNHHGASTFWDDLTDSLGNFAVKMDTDTSGGPWHLSVQNDPFPGDILSPSDTALVLAGDISGITFTFSRPAAKVTGLVRDENGNPLADIDVGLSGQFSGQLNDVKSNSQGFFTIGLTTANLSMGPFQLQNFTNEGPVTTTTMQAQISIASINPGDSLYRVLTVYPTNATIRGRVTVNGLSPNMPVWLSAMSQDTCQSVSVSDSASGSFMIPVTDKVHSYSIAIITFPNGWQYFPVTASPGDSNVSVAVTVSAVKDEPKGKPLSYSLDQNYPNPWNPTTAILYGLPFESNVRLRVYNLLGQCVATLIDGVQSPGYRIAMLDGRALSSGVYFYRLDAASTSHPIHSFSQIRKMLLVK